MMTASTARRRTRPHDTIRLQMAAMIDVVFLLLVFFVMTFRIVPVEGDFNVKMPLHADCKSRRRSTLSACLAHHALRMAG